MLDVKQKKEILKNSIANAQRQAYSLYIDAEYQKVQGSDEEAKKEAEANAGETMKRRDNILKGINRLEELLADLSEEEDSW